MTSLPCISVRQLLGHRGSVNSVHFTHDGNYCMTCSEDRSIKLWNPHKADASDPKNALLIKNYSGTHGYGVLDVAISQELTYFQDNTKFASVGGDKNAFVYDIATGSVLRRLPGHTGRINSVALNNDASVIFTASYDKTVRINDLRSHTRDAIQILSDFKDSVTCVALTSTQVLCGSVDNCIRTYDLRYGVMHCDDLHAPVTHVSTSYDEKCVVATCLNDAACLLEVTRGRLLQSYTKHRNSQYKMESHITNDDAHVVTGSEDGSIYYYDIVQGSVVHTWKAHTRTVSSLSYHPTNALLLSGSHDGKVALWGVGR